jgi:hypothetical protein
MSEKKETIAKENKWIEGLQNKDLNSVIKTIEEIQENGNVKLLKPLIELGIKSDERKIQDAIQKVLFSLKVSAAHPIIIEELFSMQPIPFRRVLLSTLWESNINAMDHLDKLVKIAIEGDLYEAIEVVTLLEESEDEVSEEKILDSLLLLKEHALNKSAVDNGKEVFIDSIAEKINEWNNALE